MLDASLHQGLVQEHLDMLVDERAQKLLLLVLVTVTVLLACDQRLEADRVDLSDKLLLSVLPGDRLWRGLLLGRLLCRLLSCLLRSVHLGQSGEHSNQQLALLRLKIVFDRAQHFVSLLRVLMPEEPLQLSLVNLLHHVGLSQLLPLELIDVQLVRPSEKLFADIEPSLLS